MTKTISISVWRQPRNKRDAPILTESLHARHYRRRLEDSMRQGRKANPRGQVFPRPAWLVIGERRQVPQTVAGLDRNTPEQDPGRLEDSSHPETGRQPKVE